MRLFDGKRGFWRGVVTRVVTFLGLSRLTVVIGAGNEHAHVQANVVTPTNITHIECRMVDFEQSLRPRA